MAYCSEACRQRAWQQYHQVLCAATNDPSRPLHKLLEAWKAMHHPPEATTVELAARVLAGFIQAGDKAAALAVLQGFAASSTPKEEECLLSRLLGEEDCAERLRTLRELMAALFQDHLCVTQWLTQEGFRSLMALVVRSGQMIGTSALGAWVNNCNKLELPEPQRSSLDAFTDNLYDDVDRESGPFLNNEGVGLYPLQSLCSHSCAPNTESAFLHNNYVLSLVALREIGEGEEITVSYLDECSLSRSRHSRAKLLRENHLLICDCMRCEAEAGDQPDVTSDEEMDDDESDDWEF